jgi:hypothetical protein
MLAQTAEKRSRDSRVSRLAQAIFDVELHALILLEVLRDEFRRLVRTDAELLGKTERRLTIDDPEVHCLRSRSLSRRDGFQRQPEHRCCRAAVNIFSSRKRFSQSLVCREVSEDTELDL